MAHGARFPPSRRRFNLLPHIVDLVADNGDKLYGTMEEMVFLLTCDEYRKYRDVIPKYRRWIWTCTPWTTTYTGTATHVRYAGFFWVNLSDRQLQKMQQLLKAQGCKTVEKNGEEWFSLNSGILIKTH